MARTVDAAIGKWSGILVALGVDQKFLVNRHGPCPCCGGVDRYRFDDRNGSGSYFCSGCGSGDGIQLLMRMFGWSFREAAANVDGVVGNVQAVEAASERTEAEKIEVIKRALKESKTVVKNDPVWLYLNRRTGIENIPGDLRFHPSMRHSDGGNHPVMLAIMRDSKGNGVSVHRTYLTSDGKKAAVAQNKKFMQGKPLNGSSVWLGGVCSVAGIAEGIETSIAASIRFSVPVFAATNATLLEAWVPPDAVKNVVIFGDNDVNYAGQSAAYRLANRLVGKGYLVDVKMPDRRDSDWCDPQ